MRLRKHKQNDKQNGIALLLTIIVLSIVMLISVLITTIVITQLKLSSDIDDSVVAVYAADSGIEWQLYQIRQGVSVAIPNMTNGAVLTVTSVANPPRYNIKSLGSYRNVKRQFEVNI